MRRLALAAGFVLALGVLVVALWRVDVRAHRTTALRRVTVAGRGVGGEPRATVLDAVRRAADRYASQGVTLHTPKGDVHFTAAELGLTVDVDASVARALDLGRDDSTPIPWLVSLVRSREAGVVVHLDGTSARAAVAGKDPTSRREPREPGIAGATDGQVAVVLGVDGKGIDADQFIAAVESTARAGSRALDITLASETLHPRFTRADATALATRARSLVGAMTVRAGDASAEVSATRLRSWLSSAPSAAGLQLSLDRAETLGGLRDLLAGAGVPAVDATFAVTNGVPSIVPGVSGSACCDDAAIDRLVDAIERGRSRVQLPLRTVEPSRTAADLRELGVVEEIGSFTTRHKCCENRVQNIHRIADLVRGVVIRPGAQFSINEYVGERTTEKGFVVDRVIENGSFAKAVGGGVSQFATTTFNAAFFAGLDLKEYQSHSIYIQRYPYGREATLSYPKPDLVIGNSTPYGVLIWPTYTDTSLTVTLYSTRYARGEQTGQSEAPVGPNGCKRVTTERTRTYVDGTVKTDKVFAVYRPSEGVQCR